MSIFNFSVIRSDGFEVARCRFAGDAIAIVCKYGDGAQVLYGRVVVWTEGKDGFAGNDVDRSTKTVEDRVDVELEKLRLMTER